MAWWGRNEPCPTVDFEGATAEEHFVRNSALLLTLREAGDGSHLLVNTAVYRESDDSMLLTFNFVSNGEEASSLPRGVVPGQVVTWSNNATDRQADPTDLSASGRGRSTASGHILGINFNSNRVRIARSDVTKAFPSSGDVVYFPLS